MAVRMGIGKDRVAGIRADHQLNSWKVDTVKISNDPRFEGKLVDVVAPVKSSLVSSRQGPHRR